MSNGSSPVAGFILLAIAFIAYFLPTFIASKRDHPNGTSIFLLNLFLGWTFIGWLGALIWSASAITKAAPAVIAPPATEDKFQKIEKLGALREKGLLTDAEYESEKAKLLQS
ncbi:superinfection immunity protein [Pseudomonas brassicacearum]|uniref:superinfection immunity protein n=1 Tax=Pseudomonas brassicacearum TaxID=930166 RepID=UPI0005182FF8|nr:superinfection immunity protein [Pseudomonas brassicacearum]